MSNKVKLVLIDLSGTLHVENTAIPGAIEAIKRLRNSHVTLKFVTNTSKESKHVLHNRLIKLGFDIKIDEIFSSLVAAKHIIRHYKINPLLIIDNAALEEFDNLVDFTSPFNAVVIGLAPDKLNYENLNNAFRLLLNGARLIAIHEARYYKSVDGLSLGPGAFIKGLEYSANVKAEVIGKPTSEFFKAALEGISPEDAIMIGDDIKDDIAGAQLIGIKGFLVETGKYCLGDENLIEPFPTKVCNSITHAVDIILKDYI